MKMKPEDYAFILERMRKQIEARPDAARIYREEGMTFQRYIWDMLWRCRLKIGDGAGRDGDINLYAYLNDDHITTALRACAKECGVKEW